MQHKKAEIKTNRHPSKKVPEKKIIKGSLPAIEKAVKIARKENLDLSFLRP